MTTDELHPTASPVTRWQVAYSELMAADPAAASYAEHYERLAQLAYVAWMVDPASQSLPDGQQRALLGQADAYISSALQGTLEYTSRPSADDVSKAEEALGWLAAGTTVYADPTNEKRSARAIAAWRHANDLDRPRMAFVAIIVDRDLLQLEHPDDAAELARDAVEHAGTISSGEYDLGEGVRQALKADARYVEHEVDVWRSSPPKLWSEGRRDRYVRAEISLERATAAISGAQETSRGLMMALALLLLPLLAFGASPAAAECFVDVAERAIPEASAECRLEPIGLPDCTLTEEGAAKLNAWAAKGGVYAWEATKYLELGRPARVEDWCASKRMVLDDPATVPFEITALDLFSLVVKRTHWPIPVVPSIAKLTRTIGAGGSLFFTHDPRACGAGGWERALGEAAAYSGCIDGGS